LVVVKGGRDLNQPLIEGLLRGRGFEPDFFPHFMAGKEAMAVEKQDAAPEGDVLVLCERAHGAGFPAAEV
jgi:hypothetical protein